MNKVSPIRDNRNRWFDYVLLMEGAEANVREAIERLPVAELAGERTSLVDRLQPPLVIQSPAIDWSTSSQECRCLGQGKFRHSLVASISDPSWVLWSVEWPIRADADAHFSTDPEKGSLVVVEHIEAETAEAANHVFQKDLEAFKVNLARAEIEFERYNAALPYLISYWIEVVLERSQTIEDS